MSKKIITSKCNNYYILNTNERYEPNATKEMIKYKKASCYGSARQYLNKLQIGDSIYLYQNKVGIVAYGTVASNIYYKANEAYVKLENFINIIDAPKEFPYNRHTLYKPNKDYIKLLPGIKKAYNVWLLPSKENYDDFFKKNNNIIWHTRKRINLIRNDIVYMYVTSEKKIRYKCKVVSNVKKKGNTFVFEMKLLSIYGINNEEFTYESLKVNGLLSTIQSAEKLNGNLLNYINEIDRINDFCIKIGKTTFVNRSKEITDYIIDENITIQNNDSVKEKQKISYSGGKIEPLRNFERAVNALKKAKYLCEYSEKDKVFKRKSGTNYTESHHLIPISKYNDFKYSLDVEGNIVSLCCYCHRVLHYGKMEEKIPILKKLYRNRIKDLEECGLKITFNKLLGYYK